MTKDEEIEHLRQENQILRAGLKQALSAIDFLQERVNELERQKAKDSHNRSLPPSADRFVRPRHLFAANKWQEARWPAWSSRPSPPPSGKPR